jgi:hypothetical protein
MLSKFGATFTVLAILCAGVFYFLFTPSYQKSIEARFFYLLGDYEVAYELSLEAYELESYNKMAFTIMTQSKIAMKYEKYIQDADDYFQKIELISAKEKFMPDDKARVKMMCEIMIEEHKKLTPTKLTSQNLIDDAKARSAKFESLYKELFLKENQN